MTPNDPRDSRVPPEVSKIVDLVVFAPIGLGTALVEDGPDAIRRAQQELRNARFVGRFAVDRGIAEVRRRIDDITSPTPPSASEARPVPEPTVPPVVDATAVQPDVLALPDYDTLPAIDIVDKLEHLSSAERSAIGEYEQANRRRRTVLGKLAQLADA